MRVTIERKDMIYRYLLSSILFISINANANNWEVIAQSAHSEVLIDKKKISLVEKNIYKTWVLTNIKSSYRPSIRSKFFKSYIDLVEVDCTEQNYLKTKSLATNFYADINAEGDLIEHTEGGSKSYVVPGTVQETLATTICFFGLLN
jgi:hypothetical protein